MAAFPGVGDEAPDFALPGTGARTYELHTYRGAPVVLVFYPGDDTPVCTAQLTNYSASLERFTDLGAQVLAISPQGPESHSAFAEKYGLTMPLLSDIDKLVGASYNIVGPLGFYRRSAFVVDAAGVVRYAHRATAGLTFRSTDELIEAVKAAS